MYYLQTILFICFILICCTIAWNGKEHFWFIPERISICDNVLGLSRRDCKRCTNTGICTFSNGEQQCVPGDFRGPTNGQDCVQYEYGNDYANLSLIDSPQPYWADTIRVTNKPWHWKQPIHEPRGIPQPSPEEILFFRHGSSSQQHHKKL